MIVCSTPTPAAPAVARIHSGSTTVTTYLPEVHEGFRALVRSLGYRWTGAEWRRSLDELSGLSAHRAAELLAVLLAAGFQVDAPDEIVFLA